MHTLIAPSLLLPCIHLDRRCIGVVRGQERSRCSRANNCKSPSWCMPSGEPRSQAKQPGFSRHVAIHAKKALKLTNNMIGQRRYGSVGRADDRRASATTPLLLLRAIVSVRSSGGVWCYHVHRSATRPPGGPTVLTTPCTSYVFDSRQKASCCSSSWHEPSLACSIMIVMCHHHTQGTCWFLRSRSTLLEVRLDLCKRKIQSGILV
jgi:hypothetical protein